MADSKGTGFRKNPNARGLSNTGLQALGIGEAPQYKASIPSIPAMSGKNLRLQDTPLGKVSALANALGSKLETYQQQNQKKWASEAALKADRIIDDHIAKGMTFEQIEKARQAGDIPELDTVLQERSFNFAFGAASATNFFTTGKGSEEYQKSIDEYKSKPYNERSTYNHEQVIATIANKFRDTNNQNLDLLLGSSQEISKWSTEKRAEFLKVKEQLNDSDRVQTGSTFLLTTMNDFAKRDADAGKTFDDYKDSFHSRLEAALDRFGRNNNVSKAYYKQIKLNAFENFITKARVDANNGKTEDAVKQYRVVMHGLSTSAGGSLPKLINDRSVYTALGNTGEAGTSIVQNEAQRLYAIAEQAISKLVDTDNTAAIAKHLTAQLMAGQEPVALTRVEGANVSVGGVSAKRDKVTPLVINSVIAQVNNLKDVDGKPLPSFQKNIKIFDTLSRIGKEQALNYFKGDFNNLEYLLNEANTDNVFDNFWNGDGKGGSFEKFQAMRVVGSPLVDHYLPPETPLRRFFERFAAERHSGNINSGNIKAQLPQLWEDSKAYKNPSPQKQTEISDMVTTLDGDIASTNSFFELGVPPFMRGVFRQMFQSKAKYVYYMLDGDELKDKVINDVKERTIGFNSNGTDHILTARTPKNLNLLRHRTVPGYLSARIEEFVTNNKIPRGIAGGHDVTIRNDTINGDVMIFVHKETGKPIALHGFDLIEPGAFKLKAEDADAYVQQEALERNKRRQRNIADAVKETEASLTRPIGAKQ